jgi:hypothetical protein
MNFIFVDELGLNLSFDLNVLIRNSQRYSILMYQHEGIFFADNTRIGNQSNVSTQFNLFFEKAKETNVDLALTPEYSCPWSVIDEIISDPLKYPNERKLWVIGCESIRKAEIRLFKERFNHGNLLIYFDETLLNENNNFFDPVVYLFKAIQNGIEKLIVLIQFKTFHMGVWDGGEIERDNLVQGKEIYILRNSITPNSIFFMTIICSEALNFRANVNKLNDAKFDWLDKPFLLFNPQFNPKPIYDRFIDFRKCMFETDRKEVITLNWNHKSKIGSRIFLKSNNSRSGITIKSEEINLNNEDRIKTNHSKGCYYFNKGKNKHVYLLNSAVHVFHLQTPAVAIANAEEVQRRRDGPEIIHAYELTNENRQLTEITVAVSDQHIKYLTDTGCSNPFLINVNGCILQKERLVSISIGEVKEKAASNWWHLDHVHSIAMDENSEVNFRITFTEDTDIASINERTKYLHAVNKLNEILETKPFPESIHDLLTEDLILSYYQNAQIDDYKYNVITEAGEKVNATIAYLEQPPPFLIEETFIKLQKLFNWDNKNKERVVIFYSNGKNILAKSTPNSKEINTTNDFDDSTFLK